MHYSEELVQNFTQGPSMVTRGSQFCRSHAVSSVDLGTAESVPHGVTVLVRTANPGNIYSVQIEWHHPFLSLNNL